MNSPYQKIPRWDYHALFQAFGPSYKTKHWLIKTPDELEWLLSDEDFNDAKVPQVRPPFPLTFAAMFTYHFPCLPQMTKTNKRALSMFQLVELCLPPDNAPRAFKKSTATIEESNARKEWSKGRTDTDLSKIPGRGKLLEPDNKPSDLSKIPGRGKLLEPGSKPRIY